ncbi:unnamed protein product [Brugia timori]|uniref:Uncharacterized protein n=1 Tax=Brugia timori TaxID=42155 RepID=A0A3P7UL34_9BILA|nr:unnamed protein product [Brugia timori]
MCIYHRVCVPEMERSQNSWVAANNVSKVFENKNSFIVD